MHPYSGRECEMNCNSFQPINGNVCISLSTKNFGKLYPNAVTMWLSWKKESIKQQMIINVKYRSNHWFHFDVLNCRHNALNMTVWKKIRQYIFFAFLEWYFFFFDNQNLIGFFQRNKWNGWVQLLLEHNEFIQTFGWLKWFENKLNVANFLSWFYYRMWKQNCSNSISLFISQFLYLSLFRLLEGHFQSIWLLMLSHTLPIGYVSCWYYTCKHFSTN